MAKSGSKTDILLGLQGAIAAAQELGDQRSEADKKLRQSIKDILEATITERGANLEEGKFGETRRVNTASIEQAKGELGERKASRQQEQFTNRAVTAALFYQKQNPTASPDEILSYIKRGEPPLRMGAEPPPLPGVRVAVPPQTQGSDIGTAAFAGAGKNIKDMLTKPDGTVDWLMLSQAMVPGAGYSQASVAGAVGAVKGVRAEAKRPKGELAGLTLDIQGLPPEAVPYTTNLLSQWVAGEMTKDEVFDALGNPPAGTKKVPGKVRAEVYGRLTKLEELKAQQGASGMGTPNDLIKAGTTAPPVSGMPPLPSMPSLPQAQRTTLPPPGSGSVVAGDLLKNVQPGSVLDQARAGVSTPIETPIPRLVGEEKDIWSSKLADLSKSWNVKNAFAFQQEMDAAYDAKRIGNEDYTELNVALGKMRLQKLWFLQEGKDKGGF